jgi:hypothetical protein
MTIVRNTFRLKFGQARETLAIMKGSIAIQRRVPVNYAAGVADTAQRHCSGRNIFEDFAACPYRFTGCRRRSSSPCPRFRATR